MPAWIGVDGGATKALAVAVDFDRHGLARVMARSGRIAYTPEPGFGPVPLVQQLEERSSGRLRINQEERRQGRNMVRAIATAIARVTEPGARTSAGLCLAGLKTPDGMGVAVCANGARTPGFASELARELRRLDRRGVTLVLPLSSDGYCSGLGEATRVNGRLRTVSNGYYAGAGTGLAEAVKLEDNVLSMDQVAPWFPKAWQMDGSAQGTAEDDVSARGLMRLYAGMRTDDGATGSPLSAAVRGDVRAQEALGLWATAWGRFIARRLALWSNGRPDHPLQRVVIGQRAGIALATPALRSFFRLPLEQEFVHLTRSAHPTLGGYVKESCLKRGFITASPVLEVPAIGAAVLAFATSVGGDWLRI